MAEKSRQEIVIENREFYNEEYTSFLWQRQLIMSFILSAIYLILALVIERMVFRAYYLHLATITVLSNDTEVVDWVAQQTNVAMLSWKSGLVLLCFIFSIVYMVLCNKCVKNYNLYKFGRIMVLIPVLFWLVVLGFVIYLVIRYDLLNMNFLGVGALLTAAIEIFPLIFAARTFVTAETRAKSDGFWKFLECISNFISKHM